MTLQSYRKWWKGRLLEVIGDLVCISQSTNGVVRYSVPKCRTTRLILCCYCISISGRIYILASYLFCYLRRSPTACFPIGIIAIYCYVIPIVGEDGFEPPKPLNKRHYTHESVAHLSTILTNIG